MSISNVIKEKIIHIDSFNKVKNNITDKEVSLYKESKHNISEVENKGKNIDIYV